MLTSAYCSLNKRWKAKYYHVQTVPVSPSLPLQAWVKIHYMCVYVCAHQSTLVLPRASGKSFLGQTYHSHKCGHHASGTLCHGQQTERQRGRNTHTHTPHLQKYIKSLLDNHTEELLQHKFSLMALMGSLIFARKLTGCHVKRLDIS